MTRLVSTEPLGGVATGWLGTSLYVSNAAHFPRDGGQFTIEGQETSGVPIVFDYTSVSEGASEEDPDILVTASAAPAGMVWDDEKRVLLYPGGVLSIAEVETPESADDTIPAIIPHSLKEYLPDGIRDINARESVLVEMRGSEWVVVDVLDQAEVFAVDMAETLREARETAEEAVLAAAAANAVRPILDTQPLPATRSDGSPLQGGDQMLILDSTNQTQIVGIRIWVPGTGWVPYSMVAHRILALNSITTPYLAATAIDGMTVTGATVQTNATANRGVKMKSDGITVYDSSGTVVGRLREGEVYTYRMTMPGGAFIGKRNSTDPTIALSNPLPDGVEIYGGGSIAGVTGSGYLLQSSSSGSGVSALDGSQMSGRVSDVFLGWTSRWGSGDGTSIQLSASTLDFQANSVKFGAWLPASSWQRARPLMLDGNGWVYQWNYAPQRPLMASATIASGTVIASGGFATVNIRFSAAIPDGDTIRSIVADLSNFPPGSAWLTCRVASWTASSAVIRVINTGAASVTLGGALGVRATVLI